MLILDLTHILSSNTVSHGQRLVSAMSTHIHTLTTRRHDPAVTLAPFLLLRAAHGSRYSTYERWGDYLRLYGYFAEYCIFHRVFLQKRPIIFRSLLIEATPYQYLMMTYTTHLLLFTEQIHTRYYTILCTQPHLAHLLAAARIGCGGGV